jgi:nickel/cobalt exporter
MRLHAVFPRRPLRLLILLALLVFLLPGDRTAQAHPADMYLQTHTVSLRPDGLDLTWQITPGAMLAYLTWDEADVDSDSFVSQQEAIDWAAPHIGELVSVVDETVALPWRVTAIEWPEALAEFEMGTTPITIRMEADWPEGYSGASFILYSRFQEASSINWFILSGVDGVRFTTPEQENGLLRLRLILPGDAAPEDIGPWLDAWDSGTPTLAAGSTVSLQQASTGSNAAVLTGLVSSEDLSLPAILAALGVAIVLGAIHALTPGHGKTLVAAYLVGSRGTLRHAAALGAIVTLTHTGSVLGLGLLTLVASQYVLPSTVFPLLEAASGLLIIGMGLVLIGRRWRGWQAVRRARRRAADPAPAAPATGKTRTIAINQPIQAREFDVVLPRGELTLGAISWRSLITLGVSGGLVPCPDAIAILLVAVAINRLVLGLSMVVAFSLGLAAILIAIGIALVQSRHLVERFEGFNRLAPALPLVSAVIVLGLGILLTANALTRTVGPAETAGSTTLAALGVSADSPLLGGDNSATAFDLATAQIVYLVPVARGRDQLYRSGLGAEPVPLTDETQGVLAYALGPDERTIAYSAPDDDGNGSRIMLLDAFEGEARLALDCPQAVCQNPVWAPEGTRLGYERFDFAQTGTGADVTTIWWLDVESGETAPVFQDRRLPGISPRWSADGAWLSYVSPGTTGVQIYDLRSGERYTLPSLTSTPALWNPRDGSLLLADVQPNAEGRYLTHLLRFDVGTGALTDLTGPGALEDSEPAWSPDGTQIVFMRRDLSDGNLSPGNAVWVMAADGRDARALTDTPDEAIHLASLWSPDGSAVLVTRYTLGTDEPVPTLVLIDVATGEARIVAQPAQRGAWAIP